MKELQLKYSDIEINYQKIPLEQQKNDGVEAILNQSEEKLLICVDSLLLSKFNLFIQSS